MPQIRCDSVRTASRASARRGRAFLPALALLLVVLAPIASAQGPPAAPAPTPPAELTLAEQIAARRAELTEELARARAQRDAAQESGQADLAAVLAREVELLERVDFLLNQQLATEQQIRELETTKSGVEQQLTTMQVTGPPEPPPYSLLQLDAVRDELRAQKTRADTSVAAVQAATDARDQASRAFDEKETARRQARTALESNRDDLRAAALAQVLRHAQLESRVAGELLQLRRQELERERAVQAVEDLRLRVLQERQRWIARNTVFSQEDLQAVIVDLTARIDARGRDLERAEFNKGRFEDWRREATSRSERVVGTDPVLVEEVGAANRAYDAADIETILLGRRLERLEDLKTLWERRFQIAAGLDDRSVLGIWENETRTGLTRLENDAKVQELKLSAVRQDLVALEARLDAARTSSPDLVPWLVKQQESLRQIARLYEENTTTIETARRLHTRLLADLGAEAQRVTFGERIAAAWRAITTVWDRRVALIDDKEVSVGNVVLGILLLLIGFFASRFIAALLGKRVLPRLGMNEGAAAAVRTLAFYFLLVTFVLLSLKIVSIPLTAFTILGGALAIGVGFGSQNIINNFISGLILIAERPIRVGDLIQVDDLYGSVQHIGARSTVVRTGENIELVVPNSRFLEQNVVNWTLSETKVRVSVAVGVIYGSPVREVTRLLEQAVSDHGRVLKSPAPIILFTDFGDNALLFEIHFWIRMRSTMDRKIIQSDVRYRIDSLFAEAGLVIAFPQRDVHLDTVRPLEVRMLPPQAGDPRGAAPGA